MGDQSQLDQILCLEWAILRALCSGNLSRAEGPKQRHEGERAALSAALRELRDYRWRDEEHLVVYGALAAIKHSSGETVAEQLPAQATRMGFPDVDWKLYLQPIERPPTDILEMIRTMKGTSTTKS